jgi:hypothetical protein
VGPGGVGDDDALESAGTRALGAASVPHAGSTTTAAIAMSAPVLTPSTVRPAPNGSGQDVSAALAEHWFGLSRPDGNLPPVSRFPATHDEGGLT